MPVVHGPEVVRVVVPPPQLGQPLLLAGVDVRLYRGLARADQAGVPQAEAAQTEEASRAHEGLVKDKRLPREHSNVEIRISHL